MSDDDDPEPVPSRRREPLWQRLAVGMLALLIATIAALPTRLAYALGSLLAVPWYLYWSLRDRRGRHSSGYWRNVRIGFRKGSPLGERRPPHHLWRWSQHIAWILIDFCRMTKLTKANLRQHCDFDEFPVVEAAFRRGKGLICATGHVGVWDVAGTAAGLLGLPITSVFRPSPLPALNRLIERLRTRTGQTVVARKKVMWTLKRVLADKEMIGILADGGGKHSSVVAPFFGTPSRTVATPALLHLLTGSPIAVVVVLRTGPMRYRLRVYDIIDHAPSGDREADLVSITSRINEGLGRAIAEAPEQWFWQSRRFRHRPPGEQLQADGLPPLVVTGAAGSRR
jgi:KDO2-lipid IV(A) lauroyltransferase